MPAATNSYYPVSCCYAAQMCHGGFTEQGGGGCDGWWCSGKTRPTRRVHPTKVRAKIGAVVKPTTLTSRTGAHPTPSNATSVRHAPGTPPTANRQPATQPPRYRKKLNTLHAAHTQRRVTKSRPPRPPPQKNKCKQQRTLCTHLARHSLSSTGSEGKTHTWRRFLRPGLLSPAKTPPSPLASPPTPRPSSPSSPPSPCPSSSSSSSMLSLSSSPPAPRDPPNGALLLRRPRHQPRFSRFSRPAACSSPARPSKVMPWQRDALRHVSEGSPHTKRRPSSVMFYVLFRGRVLGLGWVGLG